MAANRDKPGAPAVPIQYAQMISLLQQQHANLLDLTLYTEAVCQKR